MNSFSVRDRLLASARAKHFFPENTFSWKKDFNFQNTKKKIIWYFEFSKFFLENKCLIYLKKLFEESSNSFI